MLPGGVYRSGALRLRSGGIRCVLARGNRFSSPDLTYALRLKTNARRGGFVEDICLCDSVIEQVHGAAAVSVLPPMFLKPAQDELFLHFQTIAGAVPEIPVLIYNNPGRVGYGLAAAFVSRLAHEIPNIVGMKDTSGDMTLTKERVRLNRDVGFKVLGGRDTLLYCSLCVGGVGGVCTAGNFMPELIGAVYEKFMAGDLAGALEAQFKLNPVRLAMDAASFLVAAKDMAALRGLDAGLPYLPNLPAPAPVLEQLRAAMREAGLI